LLSKSVELLSVEPADAVGVKLLGWDGDSATPQGLEEGKSSTMLGPFILMSP
ncbi:hypothetical protein A2U01_0096919, partial [Trifolium medium]|nr:hypothetical protein [Trifolium medium]